MKIKFNHIQDLGDARYASAVMAEWMGFAIDGEHAISPEKIQQIISWCSGPKIILEIYNQPNLDKIQSWFDILPIDGIECNESAYSELKTYFHEMNLEWIVRGNQIYNIANPNEESANWVIQNQPNAISINCEIEKEIGKKDYEMFNLFFETLEIL